MSNGPQAGQRGRYVLGELLGRGGMGEVFAGYAYGSHGFQKPVAIKRIVPELANDETFVERLIGEAKLLVGIQHSNIVSVLDLTREGDDLFLVMEFVDGPSLYQLMKAREDRRLSFGIASYIIQSAAAGLQFAHARKGGAIIHADISPANLLLSTSGEVRVADFGIAQREGRASGAEGKWAYMAPEQLRGEALTQRCDVFALGLVLYELLTLRHAFGPFVSSAARLKQPHHIVPPRVINADIPPGLDQVCMRALAEDPADRIGTMQGLIDALLDQRFANAWREGAGELAAAIGEVTALSHHQPAGTQLTGRPVTLVNQSLIGVPTNPGTPRALEAEAEHDLAPTGLFVVPENLVVPADHEPSGPLDALGPVEPTVMVSGELTTVLDLADLEPTVGRPAIERPPGQRKYILLGLGAVAVIACVLVIAIPGDDLKPAQTALVAEPSDAAVDAGADAAIDAPTDAAIDAAIDAAPQEVAVPIDAGVVDARPKKERIKRPPPPPPQPQTGWLRVATADGAWAKATLRAESFDIPGASFKLKPGTNTVTLKDARFSRTCTVPFKPGSQTLTVSMKSGKCVVR